MDSEQAAILAEFGLGSRNLIAEGGESLVYALGRDKILRLPRDARRPHPDRLRQQAFLDRLAGRLPFATPDIVDIGPDDAYTIERRLPGYVLADFLKTADHTRRDLALRNYLAACEAIHTVTLPESPYGHVLAPEPMLASDWRTFLHESLASFLSRNRVTIAKEVGDPYELFDTVADTIATLPDLPEKCLVHGDFFPGNVLIDDQLNVSAVLDFGTYTVVGDPMLDLAVAYLTLEQIEESTTEDARYVRGLILERHGAEFAPALTFYRAYIAFSMADPALAHPPYPRLYGWSVAMLKLLAAGRFPA